MWVHVRWQVSSGVHVKGDCGVIENNSSVRVVGVDCDPECQATMARLTAQFSGRVAGTTHLWSEAAAALRHALQFGPVTVEAVQ